MGKETFGEYRGERKDALKWFGWGLSILIVVGIIFFALNSLGIIGHTVVERKVFENSYQYSEARKTEIATYEAQLAEINRKLANPNLDENTRADLEAQASSIRVLLRTAKEKSE